MNVVILTGRLSRPAELRQLPSGDRLVALEVTVPSDNGGRADTVPVVWRDAPPAALSLEEGAEVVVSGRVSRRFFKLRGTGATGSRTEVIARTVVPAGRTRRVERVLSQARDLLDTGD